jgi:hypothetical protein
MAVHSFSSPAGLTVTRARRKRNGVLVGNKGSTSLPGLLPALNRSPAAWRMCPVRRQRQPVPGRRRQPGITGLALTGNTSKRGCLHIPGLRVRCQGNLPCYLVMANLAELCPVRSSVAQYGIKRSTLRHRDLSPDRR